LVGGLVILASPIAFFDDEGGAEPERLLYLAPNENLQFALRS
jgi:hypothetical protein